LYYFQFDLHDVFLIRNILAVFISPGTSSDDIQADMRPMAVKIEVRRTQDQGGQEMWTAWRYYSANCSLYFPGVTEQMLSDSGFFPSEAATSVVCVRKYFAGDTTTQTGYGYGLHEVIISFCDVLISSCVFVALFVTMFDVMLNNFRCTD